MKFSHSSYSICACNFTFQSFYPVLTSLPCFSFVCLFFVFVVVVCLGFLCVSDEFSPPAAHRQGARDDCVPCICASSLELHIRGPSVMIC